VSVDPGLFPELSAREVEITALVADGLTDKEIARQLVLSVRTVGAHLNHIYAKTGVHSRVNLSRLWAVVQEGATAPDGSPAKRLTPIRITVDLTPDLYRLLTSWIIGAAPQVEVPRLTIADTVRAMIRLTMAGDARISNALMAELSGLKS
jgi:DNA-binding CsgD family transcriptional regulator